MATKVGNYLDFMVGVAAKNDIIRQLQKEVLSLQGYKRISGDTLLNTGLGPVEKAFAGQTFPIGAVHEFLSTEEEDAAASNGFIAGLIGNTMRNKGKCLWISRRRTVFPPALKTFGIDPAKVIFVDLDKQKEILWTLEEALKCNALAAVVGELSELSFTESRRLQLAVEQSKVTGFIHRYKPRSENTVACMTRWKIKPVISDTGGLPGVGYPKWQVQLLKVRNGMPGTWDIGWYGGSFQDIDRSRILIPGFQTRKTG